MVLACTDVEYAVFDQAMTYGRWPKTDEGLRFAQEMYGHERNR